jgi:uncharacterized paraquat-inducible protein A
MATRRKLPHMLERIRRCRNCGIEVDRLPLEYEETPYCSQCLVGSVKEIGNTDVMWQKIGQYVEAR